MQGEFGGVFVGQLAELNGNTGGVRMGFIQAAVHPRYNATTGANNIAIVRVSGGESLDKYVTLSSSPSDIELDSYQQVFGWGRKDEVNKSSVLRTARLRVMSFKDCQQDWASANINIEPQMVCAGGKRDGANIGFRDEGGPMGLYDPTTQRFIQTGVASFTEFFNPDKGVNRPSVFTRVNLVRTWIVSNIRGMLICSPGYGLNILGDNCFKCAKGYQQPRFGRYRCTRITRS